MTGLRWRIVLAAVVLGVALVYALPSILPDKGPLSAFLPDKEVNLGLDLKGGVNLILGVDMEKAMTNSLDRTGDEIRSEARDQEIVVLRPQVVADSKLQFLLLDPSKKDALDDLIDRQYSNQLRIDSQDTEEDRIRYQLAMTSEYREELHKMTIDQVLEVIRNRINEFGVTEPDIRRMQDNRLQVQLPGLEDASRAVDLIQQTAHLEFQLVDSEAD
ncbi:MAG: protein translocase subunit SecD, partial [Desulfovermiculus sp.]